MKSCVTVVFGEEYRATPMFVMVKLKAGDSTSIVNPVVVLPPTFVAVTV